eukprot:382233_1
MPGKCHLCGKNNAKSCCGGCKSVFYCCRKCQLSDWVNHKLECNNNTQSQNTINTLKNDNVPVFDTYLMRIEKSKLYTGYGIIANTNISKGTILHCEKPLISLPDIIPKQHLKSYICQQYQLLSKTQKNIYDSLSQSAINDNKLLNIWNNNAIKLKQRKSSGIFPFISRLNHNCQGNSHWIWSQKCNHLRLITLFDIKKDTEITVNYVGIDPMDTNTRKQKLKQQCNDSFQCKCNWCYDKNKISQNMDKIIFEYQLLNESLELLLSNPLKGYKASQKLIKIVENKFNSNPMLMYRHCYDAAQFALGMQEWSDALFYFQLAFAQKQIAEGQDVTIDKSFLEIVNLLPDEYRCRFHNKFNII